MSKNTTTYALIVDDVVTDFVRTAKQPVIHEANLRIAAKKGFKAQVVTSGGKIVHTVARRKITKHTKPFTKVIDLPEALAALVPEGYAAAYRRPRNAAIVLRRENDIPEDDSRYGVIDEIAGEFAGFAETTRDAGQLMKALGAARKAAKAALATV
jgi:hypothetical protein